jgi:hypothetical protein
MSCDYRAWRLTLAVVAAAMTLAAVVAQTSRADANAPRWSSRIVGRIRFVGGGISVGGWTAGSVIVSSDARRFLVRIPASVRGFELSIKPGSYLLQGIWGTPQKGDPEPPHPECRPTRVVVRAHRTTRVVVYAGCRIP